MRAGTAPLSVGPPRQSRGRPSPAPPRLRAFARTLTGDPTAADVFELARAGEPVAE